MEEYYCTLFHELGHATGSATIGKPKVNAIVDQVCAATASWSEFAERYRVLSGYAGAIDKELAKLRDGMTGK